MSGFTSYLCSKKYHEITSQLSPDNQPYMRPIEGVKFSKYLSRSEKAIDLGAREIVSSELGHSRLSITKIYCG